MYAIVEIGGKQFRLASGQKLYVPYQGGDAGSTLTLDKVLMLGGDSPQIGMPHLSGVSVPATIVGHVKSDKVIVFKKKRRKRYKVLKGHRQDYTQITIGDITA